MCRPTRRRHRRDRVAPLGDVDRVREAGVETEQAEPGAQGLPAGDGAGHGDRLGAAVGDRRARVGGRGRGPGRVEPHQLAVSPDQRERVAAETGGHRLGDAEDGRRRQDRVDRVAASLERPQPRVGRALLARRDHRLERDGRATPECVAKRHGASAQPVAVAPCSAVLSTVSDGGWQYRAALLLASNTRHTTSTGDRGAAPARPATNCSRLNSSRLERFQRFVAVKGNRSYDRVRNHHPDVARRHAPDGDSDPTVLRIG